MTDDVVEIITRLTAHVTLATARDTRYSNRNLSAPSANAIDELALYLDRAVDGDRVSKLIVLHVYQHLHGFPTMVSDVQQTADVPAWLEFAATLSPHNDDQIASITRLAEASVLFEELWRSWPHRRAHLIRSKTAASYNSVLASACAMADAADVVAGSPGQVKVARTLIADGMAPQQLATLAELARALS